VFFALYYPLWRPIRLVEAAMRRLPTRSAHPNLAVAFPDARAGDVFLVRLHAPSPWGRWAHTAIALDPDRFCHGFGDFITEHRFDEFPVRYTVAHLRVSCDDETAARAAAAAAEMVGRPVSIFARPDDTSRFSCVSLVLYAYRSVGVDLRPEAVGRVVPDDLFRSPRVHLVRLVLMENASQAAIASQEVQDAIQYRRA